jgi:hypothetical protein
MKNLSLEMKLERRRSENVGSEKMSEFVRERENTAKCEEHERHTQKSKWIG